MSFVLCLLQYAPTYNISISLPKVQITCGGRQCLLRFFIFVRREVTKKVLENRRFFIKVLDVFKQLQATKVAATHNY